MSSIQKPADVKLSGLAAGLSIKAERHSEFTQERWFRGSDGQTSINYADSTHWSSDASLEVSSGMIAGNISPALGKASFDLQHLNPFRDTPRPPAPRQHSHSPVPHSRHYKDNSQDGTSLEELKALLIERLFGVGLGKRLDAAELSNAPEAQEAIQQSLQDAYGNGSPAAPSNVWVDAGVKRTEAIHESVELSATLQMQVADDHGNSVTQSVDVKIRVDRTMIHTEEMTLKIGKPKDPLVIDLTGTGFDLTGIENGTVFDLNNDGHAEKSATVAGGTGLLWMDRDGNGKLDNGSELFGDSATAPTGFDALSLSDANHDGVIDKMDPDYEKIRIHMANGAELSLFQARVTALHVAHVNAESALGQNRLDALGIFQREDGTLGALGEVQFGREDG